jgi:hypothetical protein
MKIKEYFISIIRKNESLLKFCRKIKFFSEVLLKDRFNREKLSLFIKVYPYTMIGHRRLSDIYEISELVKKENIPGDFVECGVWKGGCAAVMGFVAEKEGLGRKTWLFDSFEGLPQPTKDDGLEAESYAQNKISGKLETINKCVGPLEDAQKILFTILRLDKKNIIIRKGWFQQTLPEAKEEIGKIAILRLDGDWYESTKCCFNILYDNVVSGGHIIVDDYGCWEGCTKATDDFLLERKINRDLVKINKAGAYFKKP